MKILKVTYFALWVLQSWVSVATLFQNVWPLSARTATGLSRRWIHKADPERQVRCQGGSIRRILIAAGLLDPCVSTRRAAGGGGEGWFTHSNRDHVTPHVFCVIRVTHRTWIWVKMASPIKTQLGSANRPTIHLAQWRIGEGGHVKPWLL